MDPLYFQKQGIAILRFRKKTTKKPEGLWDVSICVREAGVVKSGLYKAFSTCSCLVSGDMTELGFTECHVITNRSIK